MSIFHSASRIMGQRATKYASFQEHRACLPVSRPWEDSLSLVFRLPVKSGRKGAGLDRKP